MKWFAIFAAVLLLNLYGCQKELSCEDCNTGAVDTIKQPPVAVAGADQTINHHLLDSCILNGASSYDPDGSIISYAWRTIDSAFPVMVVNPASARTLAQTLPRDGLYKFELRVTDNDGLSAKDTITVNVANTAFNSILFDSLRATTDTCDLQIPNFYTYLPGNVSFSIYLSSYAIYPTWYAYTPWQVLDTIPYPPFNPNLPSSAYGFWYRIENGTLRIFLPGNILCGWDPTNYDVLIRWN